MFTLLLLMLWIAKNYATKIITLKIYHSVVIISIHLFYSIMLFSQIGWV